MASTDLASLVVFMAVHIAHRTKHLAMRKRGKKYSERAFNQWVNTKRRDLVRQIIGEAFTEAKMFAIEGDRDDCLRFALEMLIEKWDLLHRTGGRPKKNNGLINQMQSDAPSRGSGRPCYPCDELRRLVFAVQGIKTRKWANKQGIKDDYSIVYKKVCDSSANQEIATGTSDANAIQILLDKFDAPYPHLPREPSKLIVTLRYARRVVQFKFPKPKSGG